MNLQQTLGFINALLEQHRIEIGNRPSITPVTWNGIDMTVEEAKLVINNLEQSKRNHQKHMNGAQLGGEITQLAVEGASMVAAITGAALLISPLTAPAGIVTMTSARGLSNIGKTLGREIASIAVNHSEQAITQIDAYICSIQRALINTLEHS